MSIYCINCGQELPDGAKFCFVCGEKLDNLPTGKKPLPMKSHGGLINAKCTSCGATLEVDPSNEAAVCRYCGSAFIVEKAINNYNITNNQNISASTVNFYGSDGQSGFDISIGRLSGYNGQSVDVVIPDTVKIIGERAFANIPIRSVVIPSGVEVIEPLAFMNTKIEKLVIPATVTTIKEGAFSYNGQLKDVTFEGPTNVTDGAFSGCRQLAGILIKTSKFPLRDGLVVGCDNLVSIKAPKSIITKAQEMVDAVQTRRWTNAFRCSYCGGEFTGTLIKKCSVCGKKKAY